MSKLCPMHPIYVGILATLLISACSAPLRVILYEERQRENSIRPLPTDSVHLVGYNDSIYRIARRYGLSTRSIILANGLQPPYQLTIGQQLKLPHPNLHKVIRGDTLYSISRRYGVSMRQLAYLNELKSPYIIIENRVLRLPGGVEGEKTLEANKTTKKKAGNTAKKLRKPSQERRIGALRPLKKPPKAHGSFIWPIEGRLISRFGAKGKGLHNDGINLAAPRGTPVRAAQSGIVAYAGNELRGFGNLLLIRHEKGLMSAYAHNEALLVKSGESVSRGQEIARVGSTGSVERPQLHFEIRKGREAINPLRYLRQQSAKLNRID